MEKLGQRFILRIFAEYREIFYNKRVGIIYTDSNEKVIEKKELNIELKKFIKSVLSSNYKKGQPHAGQLLKALENAIESGTNKKIATDFATWILFHRGIDYGAPIPEDY